MCMAAVSLALMQSASALTVGDTWTWSAGSTPPGAFVIDTQGAVQVGLRAEHRLHGLWLGQPQWDAVAGKYVYTVPAGVSESQPLNADPQYAVWSFDFSIITPIDSFFDVYMDIDVDPSAGTNFRQLGGGPFQGTWQDSWNMGMDFLQTSLGSFSFDPNAPGVYDFALTVIDRDDLSQVARTEMRVNVVPDAGASFSLLGMALVGLWGLARRTR